jgi:hypothetical protein
MKEAIKFLAVLFSFWFGDAGCSGTVFAAVLTAGAVAAVVTGIGLEGFSVDCLQPISLSLSVSLWHKRTKKKFVWKSSAEKKKGQWYT